MNSFENPSSGTEKKKTPISIFVNEKGSINEHILRSVLIDAPALINPTNENIEEGLSLLEDVNSQLQDIEIAETIEFLKYEYGLLKEIREAEEKNRKDFIEKREEHYKNFAEKSKEEIISRFDEWSKAINANIKATDAELLYRDHYRAVMKEIKKRFVEEKQKPKKLPLLSENK